MPHTVTTTTKRSRTGRPTSATAAPSRHRADTTATAMPLLRGMALLFAPSKSNELE
ncbi:hypothetical protein [Streptomyces sp. NPDC002588]|uniref:hypothetical protein n=1 Tax=Streptomyces sp. NPDC002588 TaxID=3154419 RepID=UPI003334928E